MTTDPTALPLSPFQLGIARAVEAVASPLANKTKAERDKHYRKELRAVAFNQGTEGVAAYKLKYPEAIAIRVNINSLAYSQKPPGYDDYILMLVERWLTNRQALADTNLADVGRMNDKFGPTFNPAKHFSDPLSAGRLKKIKQVFARHHAPIDITKATSMSKVRQAAKAATGHMNASRSLGNVGIISGNTLILGQQTFAIVLNGDRQCIRVVIDGTRRRLYLDEMEWLGNMLLSSDVDPLSYTTSSIGELAYPVETTAISQNAAPEMSGLAYSGPSALGARLSAMREKLTPHSTMPDEDVDPLSL